MLYERNITYELSQQFPAPRRPQCEKVILHKFRSANPQYNCNYFKFMLFVSGIFSDKDDLVYQATHIFKVFTEY